MSDHVTTLTTGLLIHELKNVTEWQSLGILLGLGMVEIKKIERDHPDTPNRRMAMLEKWMKKEDNPSWEMVVEALEKMSELGLANRLREKYCTQQVSQQVTERVLELHYRDAIVQEIEYIREKYYQLVRAAESALNANPSPRQIKMFSKVYLRNKVVTVEELFDQMKPYSFLDYKLLDKIISFFLKHDQTVVSKLGDYIQQLEEFKSSTTVRQFMESIETAQQPLTTSETPRTCTVTLKLVGGWLERTITDLEELLEVMFQDKIYVLTHLRIVREGGGGGGFSSKLPLMRSLAVDEDHTSTTADEDTHTGPNTSPDPADSGESSPPVDFSDAMDSLGLNVTMSITNIGAQGYPGTGKTSFLDLAMGKDPAETRNSTGCIDPPSRYLVAKGKFSQGVEWEHVTNEKMFDMVCDAIKETISNPPEQTKSSRSSNNQPTPSEASQPKIPMKPATEMTLIDKKQEPPDISDNILLPYPRAIKPDRSSSQDFSFLLDLLKKTQESEGSRVIFDSHWMMMTDSGGQPPFLDASALFLQSSSLQIFSLKLNEPLNHRPEFSYYIDGKSACFSKSTLKLSNQEIIETMAKSVSAIQPAFTPSAIESLTGAKFAIVGTFEDQAHLCSETVEDKESTLDEALKPYKDFQVRYGGKLILPVNAITADKEERTKMATKLRKLIVDASGVTMKVLVKLRWFMFLLNMLTTADKQKRSVLTLEECLELGKLLEMKASEVSKAIRFFHDINLIMHYNTPSLKNSVIVDAKPLLDNVTLLLSASFVDEGFLANQCGLVLPAGATELLQQHGRFCPETLEKFIKFEEPITRKFFLDVLVEVKAVAAIDESSEYIMPCALTYLPDEQCEPHPSTPWVIRLRIERGVEEVFIPLPVGYLPALVVFLLTHFKSQFGLIRKDRQFRNLFVLKYKRGGKVYIVERHLQLEIYFTSCEKLAGDCIVIRESILKAISLTEKKLRITENAITKVDSFLCSCSKNAHHVCIYNHETEMAECEVTDDDCVLEAQQLKWIKSDAAASASSSQPSTTTQAAEKPSSHVAGVSFDDDEPTIGAPPAKMLKISSLSIDTDHDDEPTSSGAPPAKKLRISSLSIDTDHDDEPTSSGAPPAKKLRISSLSIDGHDAIIGVSFDDDEPTSSGAPPAKKLKISSQSTDTGYHDAINASRPTMNELISMQKRDGSKGKLRIIEWITTHEPTQCDDFAHKLLVDKLSVKKIRVMHQNDKEKFVRAVLKRWISRDDDDEDEESLECTWEALISCCHDAGLDGDFVKLLRDNVPK